MSEENRSPVHHTKKVVELMGGPPWGFRIQGGRDSSISLKVARVNPGSKAAKCGIRDGDLISTINGQPTDTLTNVEVQQIIKKSGDRVTFELKGATKRMSASDGSSGLSSGLSSKNQATTTSLSTSQLASSSSGPAVPSSSADVSVTPANNNIGTTATSPPSGSSSVSAPTTAVATPPLTKAEKKEKKKSEKSKKKSSPSKSEEGKEKSKKSAKHQQQLLQRSDSTEKVASLGDGDGDADVDNAHVVSENSPGDTFVKKNNCISSATPLETNEKQGNLLTVSNSESTTTGSQSKGSKERNGKITGVSSSLLGDIISELDDLLDADFFNAQLLSSTQPNHTAKSNTNKRITTHDNFNEHDEGVWTPGRKGSLESSQQPASPVRKHSQPQQQPSSSCSDLPNLEQGSSSIPPVWSPPSSSPSSQKKFRPVNFNVPGSPTSSTPRTISLDRSSSSPQLPTRQPQPPQPQLTHHQTPLHTSASLSEHSLVNHQYQHQQQQQIQEEHLLLQKEIVSSPEQNDNSSRSDSICQTSSGSISGTQNLNSCSQSTVSLPKYQSPTVTLLQKAREGQLPKGARYLEQNSTAVRKAPSISSRTYSPAGLTLDLETNGASVHEPNVGKRVTDKGVEFEGIGPITPEGVPLATKPAIKSEQQHQWYKRMYESLHVERPQRRGPRHQLHGHSSRAGHYSEPEGYESDTYAYKYATLDRRKLRGSGDRYSESTDCFSPSPSTPNSVLSPTLSSCPPSGIRFTPGRIEDYTPGNSCVIAKQIRKHKPTLQWALGSRDLGYESDSNLIIRRRHEDEPEFRSIKSPPPPPLSPAEQRQIYCEIQKGGEVPLGGLRKAAPERPKQSWLNLLRQRVRSMPAFTEMKKSTLFHTNTNTMRSGRSNSPNYRSASPICKSPPPNSTVALMQERIQEKIRRSNSDLSPRPSASFRSRFGLSGVDASRIIHTVRSSSSTSQINRRSGSSYIPIRSPSVEKLRVSSPELMSPREVKKAMQANSGQQHHKLSIKLEVVKSSTNGKKAGTSDGKKSGLKKSGNANGSKVPRSNFSPNSSAKQKSVKISDRVSVENNNRATTSRATANTGSNGVPMKPPRKLKTTLVETCTIDPCSSSCKFPTKVSKVTPVASRHASCLSPHTSRPTSPGSGLSSTISISNISGNVPQHANGTKSGSISVMSSTGKLSGGGCVTPTSVPGNARKGSGKVGESNESNAATSSALQGKSSVHTGRKSIREGEGSNSGRKHGIGSNRIRLSVGKDERGKSPEKEVTKPPKQSASLKSKESRSKTNGMEKKGRESNSQEDGKYPEEENMRKSTSGVDLRWRDEEEEIEIMKCTSSTVCDKIRSLSYSRRKLDEQNECLRYWTIPPRKRYNNTLSTSLERPSSSMSLFSFRSLPALTPYLTETKRVSESLFLAKQLPLVRPTKTSALRERLAHDSPENTCVPGTAVSKLNSGKKAPGTTTIRRATGRGIIRSVSCLTLKEKLIRDYTYTNYILELQHARKRSPRFLQLHRLYSSLERLGQLERSTSLYDIPVLSAEKQLDFEAWWKVRNRLRVEEEMSSIVNQLMHAQKNREFFFRPKSPDQLKWKGDSALRCKQWNIDELRHFLLTGELLKSKLTSTSDLHKTAWRGTSVKEVALNMEVASLSKADYYYYRDKAAEFSRTPALRRAFSMSSTLSDDQKERIKNRLGSLITTREKESGQDNITTRYTVETPVVTSRMGVAPKSSCRGTPSPNEDQVVGIDGSLTESAKRQLSKTLSDEVKERKLKELETFTRIVEGSSVNKNQAANTTSGAVGKSSGESDTDSSMKTVIHIPVSTKILLRKCHEQQSQHNQQNGTKGGKMPVYSVYCTKGVPSKVTFFETFHKDTNNNKEPILIAPSEAKIVKTKNYSEKAKRRDGSERKSGNTNPAATVTFSSETITPISSTRPKSPAAVAQNNKSGSPKTLLKSKDKSDVSIPSGKRSRSVTPEKRPFDDRYMSHINVISKLASLLLKKDRSLKSLVQREVFERDKLERLRVINAGEVDRLKQYFEDYVIPSMSSDDYSCDYSSFQPEVSLLRCLFCSDPNLALLTEKAKLGSNSSHYPRRCASADIFKEKLDYFEGIKGDRIRPDGKESSPVHSRSPELYFSSRSRKPIYQPSSTPNICQPTLTAHYFLESPTKSMEFDTSCYSSDFSGNYWDYHSSTSPAPSSSVAATAASTSAYSPLPTRASAARAVSPANIAPVGLASDPNPKSNTIYSSVPPRILESRVPLTSTPINSMKMNAPLTSSGSIPADIGKTWNLDPEIHQPKYRYVPQPPNFIPDPRRYYPYASMQPGSLPPVLQPPPVPPPPTNYLRNQQSQYQPGRLQKSESFHVAPSSTSNQSHITPQLYRSVRYWNPNLKGGQQPSDREYDGGAGGATHVGLPLQRSASLNYALAHFPHNQIPPTSPTSNHNKHYRTPIQRAATVSPGPKGIRNGFRSFNKSTSSTAIDIDNQIEIIESQLHHNKNSVLPSNIIITQHDESNVDHGADDDDEAVLRELHSSIIQENNSKKPVSDTSSKQIASVVPPSSNVVLVNNSAVIADANSKVNSTPATCRMPMRQLENASSSSPVKYAESEVNIHYKAPIRVVEKEFIGEDELRRRQEIAMRRFYEEQRRRKELQEIQDMENRRHMDNFTPSQKSPIQLNRYDDVIEELPTNARGRWREKTPESKLVARALFNFIAQNSRELSFRKGDMLYIRRKVDQNWYEGEHNAAVGIFPCSYVEVIPAYDFERATPRTMTEGQAKVRFNFTAATPAEMSIIKGETVVLTRRIDANWYEGRIGARRGIFPTSYVHVIREPGLPYEMTASAKSPKPIGAPAAHSLVTQNGGGYGGSGIAYNTSRHSYKPNEYSFGADLSNIDAFINAQSSVAPASSDQCRKENIFQQGHQPNLSRSQTDPGRNRYAQNLTIDTRIEPIPYRAVYNYRPTHEDELELREGDVVHVLEKCDDGWFVGTSHRTGLFGTFPGNYVERAVY